MKKPLIPPMPNPSEAASTYSERVQPSSSVIGLRNTPVTCAAKPMVTNCAMIAAAKIHQPQKTRGRRGTASTSAIAPCVIGAL